MCHRKLRLPQVSIRLKEVTHELKDARPEPYSIQKEGVAMNGEEDNDTTKTSETEAVPEPETPAPADEPMDEKDEINRLLDEGYSVKQIIDLGFKRRTVYHYAKKRVKPENEPTSGSNTTAVGQASKGKYDMMKLGSKDVIPPEAVLDVLRLPQNGDAVEVWRRGVLDGVGILLLGARYAQLTAAGQAEIVKNQLDIMREAKEGSRDIAREAAQETAMEMANLIVQRIPKPEPSSEEPSMASRMLGPMVDLAGKQMANMFGKMFGGMLGMNPQGQTEEGQPPSPQMPSGWEYENKGGM